MLSKSFWDQVDDVPTHTKGGRLLTTTELAERERMIGRFVRLDQLQEHCKGDLIRNGYVQRLEQLKADFKEVK